MAFGVIVVGDSWDANGIAGCQELAVAITDRLVVEGDINRPRMAMSRGVDAFCQVSKRLGYVGVERLELGEITELGKIRG